MRHVDGVIVAGAGAVGLTAALCLGREGVPVTVLEAAEEIVREFRGSTFHPPTLEMLDELGVADPLIAKATIADRVQLRDRAEGLIAEFDLGLLKDHTRYPFRLQIDQYALATLLYERLRTLPEVHFEFGHRVTDVSLEGEHAIVTAETADGLVRYKAAYVVGADGGNSAVRQALGIQFAGMTYPNRYITLFTPFDFAEHLPGFAPVNYISDPGEWVIMLRSPDIWRVLFPTRPEETDAEVLRDEELQRRLQGVVATGAPYPITHRRVYRVHQRVASTYRRGRALLAGDAAHVNNPAGGMGLNGGIHDAVSLGDALAKVWHGRGDDRMLDAYADSRRRVAIEHVQTQTHANARFLSETDPAGRRLLQDELRRIAADRERTLEYLLRSSMIFSARGGPSEH